MTSTKPKVEVHTTAVIRKPSEIKTFGDLLTWVRPQLDKVLPKYITPERFFQLIVLATHKTPKLKECTPLSLINAILSAARLGLEIGSKAHLVPFKNECVLIPDYRGLADLARNDGKVKHIDARVVYGDDEFDFALGDKPFVKHKPKLRSVAGPKGDADIIAFYAVAQMPDHFAAFEVMSKAEVDAIRSRSRAKDDGPWVTDYPMMGRKTVLKRLCKFLPQSPELQAAIELDTRADTGEVGNISDIIDSPDSINQQVADQTRQKAEDLKAKLNEEPPPEAGAAPPPAAEPAGAPPVEQAAAAPEPKAEKKGKAPF